MLVKVSQHIPIYLRPFTSYSEILVENCNFFLPPLHLTPLIGCSHWNSRKTFGPQKTRMLTGSDDSLTIGLAVLTQCQRVTDGQADVQPIAITCVSLLTHVFFSCLYGPRRRDGLLPF